MPWETIRFNYPGGFVLSDNFTITVDETVKDIEADRPPFSEEYFLKGTGLELGRLGVSVRPKVFDGYDAQLQLEDFLDTLHTFTSINWNSRTRQCFGSDGNVSITPTEKYFNLSFSLPCKTDWTDGGSGSVINAETCQPILPAPTVEDAYSLYGDYAEESFSVQRRVELGSLGLQELGDLKRNAPTLVVPLKINTGNDANTWKTAHHISALAKNLQAINYNNAEREILSWKRITRRYGKCTIFLTLEFLMKERTYPMGPDYLLYSNGDFVQFENNDLAIVG
jgi:hypothetical protein